MSSKPAPAQNEPTPASSKTDENSQMLRRVAALMRRYGTPETPESYELLYTYLAGNPKQIASKVESTLARNGTLADSDIKQFSNELRKSQAGDPSLYDTIGKHLEQVFAGMDGEIDRQIRANGEHDRVFQSTSKLLQNKPGEADLRMIIASLVKQLDAMRTETSMLSTKLQDSKARVRKLRTSLVQSRISQLRDPLTGLANRGHFDTCLLRAVTEAKRTGGNLCLVMADIDHFKRLNDSFGHVVGDDVLRLFADILSRTLRGRLLAARYGGEEFAIIMPDTTVKDAARTAESIRTKLTKATLRTVSGKKPIGNVTASFGVASLESGDTPEKLIIRADSMLYRAKQTGRNRVAAAD